MFSIDEKTGEVKRFESRDLCGAPALSTNSMHWDRIHPELGLYHYQGSTARPALVCNPVLMLHGTLTSHRSWDRLAEQLWSAGVAPLYALDIAELQAGGSLAQITEALARTIRFLVNDLPNQPPGEMDVALIGYAAGGIAAYRYWLEYVEQSHLAYLFMLAAPHNRTVFPALREHFIRATTDDKRPFTGTFQNFSRIEAVYVQPSTVVVNIFGNSAGPDFDGVIRGLRLPEAVNIMLPLHHNALNRDRRVGEAIVRCLCGEFYQVKLKLVGLRMRREDADGLSGPVAFEIDRNRTPPDTLFHAVTERLYLFEEHVPPLCTLAYPASAKSATITVHLRDLSHSPGRRRRMYTRLHIPLAEDEGSIHSVQDSEGSEFVWRIVCQRIPATLRDPLAKAETPTVSRGI